MIRACIFDLGNVLVFFSHERMCQQIAELCQTPVERIYEMLMTSGLQNELETGRMSDNQFHAHCCSELNIDVSLIDLNRAAADIFWLNDDIVPILDGLKNAGMRLILLSNTSNAHFEFIKGEFDILKYFDDLTLSYEVGAMKPDPMIYADAVARSGFEPGECFFTDDIAENIVGAHAAGLQGCVFTDAKQLSAELANLGVTGINP